MVRIDQEFYRVQGTRISTQFKSILLHLSKIVLHLLKGRRHVPKIAISLIEYMSKSNLRQLRNGCQCAHAFAFMKEAPAPRKNGVTRRTTDISKAMVDEENSMDEGLQGCKTVAARAGDQLRPKRSSTSSVSS